MEDGNSKVASDTIVIYRVEKHPTALPAYQFCQHVASMIDCLMVWAFGARNYTDVVVLIHEGVLITPHLGERESRVRSLPDTKVNDRVMAKHTLLRNDSSVFSVLIESQPMIVPCISRNGSRKRRHHIISLKALNTDSKQPRHWLKKLYFADS